ncbi:hypothetical protein HIM_08638 [Hirsutella minnesotensis 3608]|uniref:RING-type domain-containing protein n=1 Tax=Hirsutella minnesotensis 3608 TaxID=1043627 RepID=A0A0F7ZSU2_9HYPO|nr:hypothetical protein HIM_08638 [Hirsutella minnesotensis 3608]
MSTSHSSAAGNAGEPAAASQATLRPAAVAVPRELMSESSDEGLRMSPAAARRFARRNLRHTSATPDLVTSLVRPPSPDAVYISPILHSRLRPGSQQFRSASILTDLPMLRAANANPDRRSGPMASPHLSSLDIPKRYGGGSVFDMYALTYVSEPDSNLLCPICHDPLVDPVTTPCDHTFCYRCLRRSIASSPSGTTCPIDRELLSWLDCFSAARLVRTQLNSLIVKCPYHARGCTQELRREAAEAHATTECRFRDFSCPDTSCDKRLPFKPKEDVCPHWEVACPQCDAKVEEASLNSHFLECPRAKTRCQGCWQLYYRSQMEAHHELECDGVEVPCPHNDIGCSVRAIRGEMSSHSRMCAFHPDTPSGMVIRAQRELIQSYSDVDSQLREMKTRQAETDRRLDEMMLSRRRQGSESLVNDNRTMQDLDAGFEEVHQNLTQLEARQSMWTLNQVMPIREEVTELRNNINMIRMHVNWLLNRSREEGRTRAANNTGSSAAIRRDSSGEAAPALPERRRSSGTEMDLPRL